MKKCFCGENATHHVKVIGFESCKYCDFPRCETCKDRAVRSYDEVEVRPLEEDE
jgi:hypothetical protein